jgi:DNA-directed RNA polymerase specialized sigma24 family protein
MTPPQTKRVIAGVRRGDESDCRNLIDHLYPVIIPIVRKNLPQRDDEEDLLQEIFVKIFSKIEQYCGQRPIAHWASRIVLEVCKLTGWGTSKVKVTAMRARRKLQAALARLEQAPPRGGKQPFLSTAHNSL